MDKSDDVLRIFREVFPEPTWKCWIARNGLLSQFTHLAVKTNEPLANGKIYGQSFWIEGYLPRSHVWKWVARPDNWADLDTWPDREGPPPELPGEYEGQAVRVTSQVTTDVSFNWVWSLVGADTVFVSILEQEGAVDWARLNAEKMANELRAHGITW